MSQLYQINILGMRAFNLYSELNKGDCNVLGRKTLFYSFHLEIYIIPSLHEPTLQFLADLYSVGLQ